MGGLPASYGLHDTYATSSSGQDYVLTVGVECASALLASLQVV